MANYERWNKKAVLKGINATLPLDSIGDGQYSLAKNVRSFSPTVIRARPGTKAQNAVAADQLPVHSIKRINDSTQGAFSYIVGIGTKLYKTQLNPPDEGWVLTVIDTGYSGLPLTWAIMRPDQSPKPYLYLTDGSKQRKVDVNGTVTNWGIGPPQEPVTTAFADPAIKDIETFESIGTWGSSGTAGAISAAKRVDTDIDVILYDDGTDGFACVIPTLFTADIQPDMRILVDSGGAGEEEILVDAVFQVATPSGGTTIQSIVYDDTGTNVGLCTIQPSTAITGLIPDCLIQIDSSEYVRVLSVTPGANGINSFRCSTVATLAASDSLDSAQSFRAFFVNTHIATDSLEAFYFEVTVTAGIGYITLGTPMDFSTINGRPTQDADIQHTSVFVDNPGNLTELKIEGDYDDTLNDFTQNFYSIPFRASDLVPFSQNTLSTLNTQQRVIQRQQIENQAPLAAPYSPQNYNKFGGFYNPNGDYLPNKFLPLDGGYPDVPPPDQYYPDNVPSLPASTVSGQTTTGNNQWSELSFQMGGWIRQGSDTSRGWQDVQAIRILFNVTDTTVFRLSSWWIGGTYGPDVGIGAPVNYRFVDVNAATGEQSNPSPPMRSGIFPVRQRVLIQSPAALDPQATRRDFYRIGGTLGQWTWIGSAVPGVDFFDEKADSDLGSNPRFLDFNNFQPFLINDLPQQGVCNVVGTVVTWVSGDKFDTAWAPGTQILLNGQPFLTYSSPTSDVRVEITSSAGSLTAATFAISEPQLQGQALKYVFGPYILDGAPIFLGVGSADEPGVLFSTSPNTPGSAQELGKLEITGPDDPLMAGGIYDGRIYVWSTRVMFLIGTVNGIPASAQPIAHAKGLYARWGLCVGRDAFYFIADDGIYTTKGGIPHCITDSQLYLLFSHAGFNPNIYNGIVPPDFDRPDDMKLEIANDILWFDFINILGARSTLLYDTEEEQWSPQAATVTQEGNWTIDEYTPSAVTHYGIEGQSQREMVIGAADGRVYLHAGQSDGKIGIANGTNIAATLTLGNLDMGDPRANKRFGDYVVDADGGAYSASLIVTKDDGSEVTALNTTFTNVGRRLKILDLDDANCEGRWARPSLSWVSNDTSSPNVYGWELTFLNRPETILERPTDYDDLGIEGSKYMQGVIIMADTLGEDATLEIQYDGGQVGATIVVNHLGLREEPYWFDTPFIARLVRVVPTSGVPLQEFKFKWRRNAAPDMAKVWQPPKTSLGFPGYWHMRDGFIAYISTTDVVLSISVDDNALNPFVYTLPSSGGLYKRAYLPLQAVKGKLTQWRFDADEPCAIFLQDCVLNAKGFGLGQSYQPVRPFGGPNLDEGALI